jgi:protein-tyrosine phosphatase
LLERLMKYESSLHWVHVVEPYRLAVMPSPPGGDRLRDEVSAWRDAKVDTVVSLLEPHEIEYLGLQAQPSLCAEFGIRYLSYPLRDRDVPPSADEFDGLVDSLHAALLQGWVLAVHCRAGIGRTGVLAGCLLHRLGVPGPEIFHHLSRARGMAMPPTPAQADWVAKYIARPPRGR